MVRHDEAMTDDPVLAALDQVPFILAVCEGPELRVLYVTGLTREVAVDRGLVGDRAALVQKPFTSDCLTHAVRTVLTAEEITF